MVVIVVQSVVSSDRFMLERVRVFMSGLGRWDTAYLLCEKVEEFRRWKTGK